MKLYNTINSILQKEEEECAKVFVEVNDYKVKKEERLKELARNTIGASNEIFCFKTRKCRIVN